MVQRFIKNVQTYYIPLTYIPHIVEGLMSINNGVWQETYTLLQCIRFQNMKNLRIYGHR
jgi:hypothetical protein